MKRSKQIRLKAILFSCIISLAACDSNKENSLGHTGLRHVFVVGTLLKDEAGKTFRIWGLNYGAGKEGLTETFWTSDSKWEEMTKDWKDMKRLGANTIRLHLQAHTFLVDQNTINTEAVDNLKKLIKFSEKDSLYVLITGLGAYLKSEQPTWYTQLNDQQRWKAHATFWREVAKAVGQNPAVLGYDLVNEPIVGVKPEEGWTPGDAYGGFHYVQNVALNTNGKGQMEVLGEWIDTLTAAIRQHDTRHFITVGYIPFGGYRVTAKHLSCMSIHVYPNSDSVAIAEKDISHFKTDSIPLIITEIFPLNASANFVGDFIKQQNKNVSGWIWHYQGRTPEEIGNSATLEDGLWKEALEKFKSMAPSQK